MLVAKQVADLITLGRGFLAAWLVALGLNQGRAALPAAVWIVIANWTGDSLDGPLARSSSRQYRTWIGDHDLGIDMVFSLGLLVYLVGAGMVNPILAGLYVPLGLLAYVVLGQPRTLGMLFQAPIYFWFSLSALVHDTAAAVWIPVWVVAALAVTWPRFPRVIIPEFLAGTRDVIARLRNRPSNEM